MKPKKKYKINDIKNKIIKGDVLEKLTQFPSDIVDLTVTSPPYNKRNNSHGWLVTNKKYSHYDDHLSEADYQKWQISVADELFRVTKPGGSLFYNHKHRWEEGKFIHPITWLEKTKWIIKQEIVWDRVLTANMRGWRFWQVDERIYWLYKPIGQHLVGKELESRHAKLSSIWKIKPASRSEDHPALFPVELPTRIIYSVLQEKGLVLDPFSGTGTTLVAAKLLGHSFVGIDLSPSYIKIARERLKNSDAEKTFIENETKKHVVNDPFAERKKRGTVNWPFGPKKKDSE